MYDIGKIFPGWQLDSLIGTGSFGSVYKIKKAEDGKYLYEAVKIIDIPNHSKELNSLRNKGMTESEIQKHFNEELNGLLNEIKIMENLKNSENIVSIRDYKIVKHADKIGWTVYIRMELLECLDTYMERNQITNSLNQEEVVKLGIDICSALDCCEKAHIVHRDVKVGNIFLDKYGTYKLGDFGVAQRLERNKTLSAHKGTDMYMAPEVYGGDHYDDTVDLYSLGITMYRLTNRSRFPFLPLPPVQVSDEDIKRALLMRMERNVILQNPCDADEELSRIIKKACSYDSFQRYQNALEMKKELRDWQLHKLEKKRVENRVTVPQQKEEVNLKSVEYVEKPKEQVRKHKWKGLMSGFVLSLCCIVCIVFLGIKWNKNSEFKNTVELAQMYYSHENYVESVEKYIELASINKQRLPAEDSIQFVKAVQKSIEQGNTIEMYKYFDEEDYDTSNLDYILKNGIQDLSESQHAELQNQLNGLCNTLLNQMSENDNVSNLFRYLMIGKIIDIEGLDIQCTRDSYFIDKINCIMKNLENSYFTADFYNEITNDLIYDFSRDTNKISESSNMFDQMLHRIHESADKLMEKQLWEDAFKNYEFILKFDEKVQTVYEPSVHVSLAKAFVQCDKDKILFDSKQLKKYLDEGKRLYPEEDNVLNNAIEYIE